MINHNDPDTARRSDPLQNTNTQQTRTITSSRRIAESHSITDDVIGSLANAYENKRARQVSEWEQMRAHMVHRSS